MYLIAGNHDWYDGLGAFMGLFCQGDPVGGRLTRQTRSYFAVQLPHRWWLWGLDTQFDSPMDRPQRQYFEQAACRMAPGDRVVLCTAKPSWTSVHAEPAAYRNLAFIEDRLIRPTGAQLVLTLSGDSHHYAHYADEEGTHKVTAGGGGAFLHPTHHLPDTLDVPVDPDFRARRTYALRATYPERRTSRMMALGTVTLPLRNPSFLLIPAFLYLLFGWASQFALRAFDPIPLPLDQSAPTFAWRDVVVGVARNPFSGLLLMLFVGGLVAAAKPPERWLSGLSRLVAKLAMGALHAGLHLVTFVVVALLAVRVASGFADGGWFTFWLFVAIGVFGGIGGGLATGVFLALVNAAPGLDAQGNEAFSAMRLTTHKNFLRLHLDHEGVLHVYPIGVRRVVKRWRVASEGKPGDSWLAPAGAPPQARLIEPAFTVGGRRASGA
jgi:hypothetical protein